MSFSSRANSKSVDQASVLLQGRAFRLSKRCIRPIHVEHGGRVHGGRVTGEARTAHDGVTAEK